MQPISFSGDITSVCHSESRLIGMRNLTLSQKASYKVRFFAALRMTRHNLLRMTTQSLLLHFCRCE